MTFFRSITWSFAAELFAKTVQPIVYLTLAKMLTPNDFGVVTAGVMVIAFAQIFSEAGLAKAVVQRHDQTEFASNAAFFLNIVLGAIFAIILCLTSTVIADKIFSDKYDDVSSS